MKRVHALNLSEYLYTWLCVVVPHVQSRVQVIVCMNDVFFVNNKHLAPLDASDGRRCSRLVQ